MNKHHVVTFKMCSNFIITLTITNNLSKRTSHSTPLECLNQLLLTRNISIHENQFCLDLNCLTRSIFYKVHRYASTKC